MEIIKQYWWVLAGLLVLLLVMSNRSSGGGVTVSQIGGGNEAALASIDAQQQMADQTNRFGLVSKLLDFLQSGKALSASERLSFAQLASNERIAQTNATTAASSANLAYQLQSAQAAAQLQAQLAAVRAAQGNSSNQMWGNIFSTGLQSFLPLLGSWFGNNSNNNSSGGGFGNINLGTFGSGGGVGGSPDWGGWW